MCKVEYDHSKLLGLMKEKHVTQERLAEVCKISLKSMSSKLLGKSQFRSAEIERIINFLEIPDDDIMQYFFIKKVHNHEH